MKGINYKKYEGKPQECHSHIGKTGRTRMYCKCNKNAEWAIQGGRLRCDDHFKKWCKKKGINYEEITDGYMSLYLYDLYTVLCVWCGINEQKMIK